MTKTAKKDNVLKVETRVWVKTSVVAGYNVSNYKFSFYIAFVNSTKNKEVLLFQ